MSSEDDSGSVHWLKRLGAFVSGVLVHLSFAALAVVGGIVVHAVVRDWRAGEAGLGETVLFGGMGLLMAAIGVGFFYLAYVGAPRFLSGLERKRKKYRDRPWLLNRQWRAGRVVHSTKYTAWFMWFWCAVWWGIVGVLWSVNSELIMADLRSTWDQAIPAALPFVAGIIGLLVAIDVTWRRVRFGDAVMLIDTLPGYLGERFRGKVQARLKGPLNEPVGMTLTCGSLRSRQVSAPGGGFQTEWITDELWSTRRELRPTQTTFDRGRVTLPVDLDLPSDLPESGHVLDDPQIVWKLEISPGSVLDRPLRSEFQVPVFARRDRA